MKTTNNYLSVFLVDDDPIYTTALKQKLHGKFKTVVKINTFSGAEECLRRIDEKPDIIVLDYYLDSQAGNHLDGLDALRKIKEVSKDITVVMLSGQEKKEVIEESLRSGAARYVAKNGNGMGILQNLLNGMVHDHFQALNAKENVRLNYMTLLIFLTLSALFVFLFYRYR